MNELNETQRKVQDRCIEEGDCWIWQGCVCGRGQRPCVNWGGKTRYVQRVVWESQHGPVKRGLVVTPSCGNRLCVSPNCLKLVTNKTSKQMAAARGAFSNPSKIRRSALTVRARSWITEEMVQQIKAARTGKEAHEATGVSLSHCKAIRRGAARASFANPFSGLGMLASNDSQSRRAA